jgi:hypothetical protein
MRLKLWRLRHRSRQGKIARKLLRLGDLDVTGDGDGRLKIGQRWLQNEVRLIGVLKAAITERLRGRIAGLERRIEIRDDRRRGKNEQRSDRIEQGRLWRKLGLYEKTLHIDLPRPARAALYIFLSGLDFYVFAQAWAIGTDSRTGEVNWWIGGLLGLVVFGAGFLAAVQLKRVVMARRQRELLAEARSPDPKLILLAENPLFLGIAGFFFLGMVVLGFLVRITNESTEVNLFMVAMAALVPLLAAVTELFLYDPMQREELRPNLLDRILAHRRAKLAQKLELREEKIKQLEQAVREKYAGEMEILRVELGDRGIGYGQS